MLIINCITT